MNILLIRSDVGLAGPAKLMHAYARALRNAGHNVQVASGGGEYAPELEKDGFRHTTIEGLLIKSRNPLLAPINILKIARLMARDQISIVNSFNAHAGLLAHLADPLRRARHFNTVLGTGKEWANRLLTNVVFPGRIIAVSNDVRRRVLEAGVAEHKISVVYNSTLDERFFTPAPERSHGSGPIRLCGIAMFTGNKGQELIIPLTAELVHDHGQDVYLTLVGDGPTRETCERTAAQLGIADRVKFTGALVDVVPELDASDIFIHLPTTETFGIVLAEAMARSLPVVTVRVGGVPEVVREAESAMVVDRRDDTEALVQTIKTLINDPASRAKMGEIGRETAHEKFSLRALQRDLERVYSLTGFLRQSNQTGTLKTE